MAIELEEGQNLNPDSPLDGREFSYKLKRVDFLDRRVYKREFDDGRIEYYPSVTSILGGGLPIDIFFLEWLKQSGANADIVRNKAGKEGTQTHEGIEKLLKGEKLEWQDDYGNARYSLQVWQMLLRFQEFYQTVKPAEVLASEMFLYSDKYKYAGTTDALFRVKDETWLLDFKTSNHLSKSYDLQLAAYAEALKERGIKIDKAGILWLKSSKRRVSKVPGVYQGDGWEIKFSTDIEKDFEAFQHAYAIYKLYNPVIEPYTKSYATEIALDQVN